MISTREELAVLYARFETELARQAAKSAEAAKQAALAAGEALGRKRPGQRGRGDGTNTGTDQIGAKRRETKKKKRSALANASNPHHLRNYVPSRVPNSGQAPPLAGSGNGQNQLGPAPLRFLSAEIAPRRRKSGGSPMSSGVASLMMNGVEEWICPFCEFSLFYGDDQGFRRAVRSRKKILRRRRRARERAAAAASGVAAVGSSAGGSNGSGGGDKSVTSVGGDGPVEMVSEVGGKQSTWKRERDK